MSEKYDLDHLIYIGEQYETEGKLSRWSLDGGLALAVLRELQSTNERVAGLTEELGSWRRTAERIEEQKQSLKREADGMREALEPFAGLPVSFADGREDQVVFTVLGGPYGQNPETQSWAGNRSIYLRDLLRARAALNGSPQATVLEDK